MNILIDIGHPAHVHYYRNLANELKNLGHKIFWTVKDIKAARMLLDYYGFNYYLLPGKKDNIFLKVFSQLIYDFLIGRICIKEKIGIAIGTSVSVAHISRILKVRSIVFDDDDDDVQPLITRYVHPYADVLLSPDCLEGKRKHIATIYYPGYHELAYLHPARFQPDKSVLNTLGISEKEPFFILRFNVFKAHHDKGIKGFSYEQKKILINLLKEYGKVFITTEREIEPELNQYMLPVSPEKMHSLLYYCRIFISDSQTMTSEAAVLGVPSLRCNSFAGRISYLEEQERKYGLTFAFLPDQFDLMITKLRELLSEPDLKYTWKDKRQRMLSEKIDVTAFWVWLVNNYPESIRTIKEKPECFNNFRT